MKARFGIAAIALVGLSGCEVRTPPADQEAAGTEAANNLAATPAASGPATPQTSEKPLAIAAGAADLTWGPCPPGMPEGCQIALLHGDPAKPNADILLKVPAGAAIAPHWHSSAERIMLVAGQLAVKYQGSPETTLGPGTYAFGPARLPHRADCKSAEPCVLFIAFEGPVDRHPFEGEI